jgi:hypothetical protein
MKRTNVTLEALPYSPLNGAIAEPISRWLLSINHLASSKQHLSIATLYSIAYTVEGVEK